MVELMNSPGTAALAVLGGVLAGIINTMAGSGSLVTLPILVALGLPTPIANATNRVGIVFQSAVSVGTLHRAGELRWTGSPWFVMPAVLGSLVGAALATQVNARTLDAVVLVVMVVMLGLILYNPKRWLRDDLVFEPGYPGLKLLALFFGIGVYGGFLQAGVGVMLLVALVLGAGYPLREANGVKLITALAFTIPALALFAWQGMVVWSFGLLMAVGQSLGAWIAATFLARYEHAALWVRRVMITVVVIAIARFVLRVFA